MKISAPFHSAENVPAHRAAIAAAQGNQAPLWAVAPNHTIEVPRGVLGPGDEVLLADVPDPAGKLSTRERMATLVGLGVVLRAPSTQHRLADVAAAARASVRFVVADQTVSVIPHMDGRTPCGQGLATKGMRVLPSDMHDGMSGLFELEARGLLVRDTST